MLRWGVLKGGLPMRLCWDCREEKPLDTDHFYANAGCRGGYQQRCIQCSRKAASQRQRDKKLEIAAYDRERNKDPGRKAARAEAQRRMRVKHPEKYKARMKVNNALRAGKLVRQPCAACGHPKAQAHHHDYTKPLDVRWLCFRCHRELAHHQVCAPF
jgi:ribosomal protein S27AE